MSQSTRWMFQVYVQVISHRETATVPKEDYPFKNVLEETLPLPGEVSLAVKSRNERQMFVRSSTEEEGGFSRHRLKELVNELFCCVLL